MLKSDKIKSGKLVFKYDKESDVLYAYINRPEKAISIEKGNGILIRKNPDDMSITGFTIIDYKKRLQKGLLKSVPYFPKISLPHFT
jgi:uncharacterized protein YuzE